MRGLKPGSATADTPVAIVASFTDAWIETEVKDHVESDAKSHLLQMRGLKQCKDSW